MLKTRRVCAVNGRTPRYRHCVFALHGNVSRVAVELTLEGANELLEVGPHCGNVMIYAFVLHSFVFCPSAVVLSDSSRVVRRRHCAPETERRQRRDFAACLHIRSPSPVTEIPFRSLVLNNLK